MSNTLLIVLIVIAVVAGLWLGARANQELAADGTGKTLTQRARQAATAGFIRLWKWNRERGKPKPRPNDEDEP